MPQNQPAHRFGLFLMVRKFIVCAFVIFTFVAYAIHDRAGNPDDAINSAIPTEVALETDPTLLNTARAVPTGTPPIPTATQVPATASAIPPTVVAMRPSAIQAMPTATQAPSTVTPIPPSATHVIPSATTVPTATSVPTAIRSGLYKDGQYQGNVADAFYGNLQVAVVVASGKITNVQFLDYPHDRRTSQRINLQAMPRLKNEVIRAQSAHVDIVSGATLTSEAFIQSLQSALSKAKS